MNIEPFLVPGMILVGLAVFGAIWWATSQAEKRRREAMMAVAAQLGYEFDPGGNGDIPSALGGLRLFGRGRSKSMRNILRGREDDVSVQVFDFRYVTGSGKNRTTHNQTVLWLQWNQLDLPFFTLSPEHIFHKIGGLFGFQDIDFPAHPQFSKQFLLRGGDETHIRQTFSPVVIDFFERHPGVHAEGGGPDLLYYTAGRTQAPESLRALIQTGMDLSQRLPRR